MSAGQLDRLFFQLDRLFVSWIDYFVSWIDYFVSWIDYFVSWIDYCVSSCGTVEKRSNKKYVVCKPYEEGGLTMLGVVTFLASMKIIWPRRMAGESSYSKLVMDNYGGEYANK